MKRPLIGIVPLIDKQRNSYWMIPGYMKGVEQAGGLPVMLPPTDDVGELERYADICGGFLLTGGQDVSSALYGEKASPLCGETCAERDSMESALLGIAESRDKAVLGICRGIQFMNVYYGGTLYQDLPSEHPSSVTHCQKPPYDIPVHKVRIADDSPLKALLGKSELAVNSYHHQAIKKLAPALRAAAFSEDGLTEAVYLPSARYIVAVQWHPELSFVSDADSRKLFADFVEASVGDKRVI